MIVSFDLDDTLFVAEPAFKLEPALPFPFRMIFRERLRLGAVAMLQSIRAQGIALWIYTTSERPEWYIRGLFRCYGIRLDGVVNGVRHAREVQAGHSEPMPSKYPPRYQIALHVDDDISVVQNGASLGFHVFQVGAQDDAWTEKLQKEIDRVRRLTESETR